jgi:archaellum biogenesis protein FlaJ (TadC family)
MKVTLKAILIIVIALALAVLGGYIWGATGRWRVEGTLVKAGAGLHLASARGHMLAARVHLFEVNFGEASRSLESAKADLMTAAEALERLDLDADAAAAREVAARVDDARQLAGRLDQTANSRLADAIRRLPKMP